MRLYKIKRKSDNRYYKGKSKFTKNGIFYKLNQLPIVLNWIIGKYKSEELLIEIFIVEKEDTIDIGTNITEEELTKVINRNKNLNEILNE
jgi:hypothetical protein